MAYVKYDVYIEYSKLTLHCCLRNHSEAAPTVYIHTKISIEYIHKLSIMYSMHAWYTHATYTRQVWCITKVIVCTYMYEVYSYQCLVYVRIWGGRD